ncbi:phospholipase D family protein [Pseudomonas sp. LRF_L74]|uniref:phospholipase D family protein n=1 Tax=Pseudomonas sp. LRF_L74 TaxID=3369422 RepID=UPI003F5E3737
MQILDEQRSLKQYLSEVRDRRITLVSAFASDTEALLDTLLANGNRLDLLVGTSNSFTSPAFIEHCLLHGGTALRLAVDFRYQASIHWNLCLIEPNQVLLGSANFTDIGMGLSRDTCVVIEDAALYAQYLQKIAVLNAAPGVLVCSDAPAFEAALEDYTLTHRRMQAGLARTSEYADGESWLGDESNQSLPLFIWYSDHARQSEVQAQRYLASSGDGEGWDEVREFFTYECAEGALPYEEGDVVLTARCNGSNIGFYTFDRILYRDGMYYIYAYRKKRYTQPFKLDAIKDRLKERIPTWYEESRTALERAQLVRLLQS